MYTECSILTKMDKTISPSPLVMNAKQHMDTEEASMMYGMKGPPPCKEIGNDSTLRAYTTCFDDRSMPEERSIDFK